MVLAGNPEAMMREIEMQAHVLEEVQPQQAAHRTLRRQVMADDLQPIHSEDPGTGYPNAQRGVSGRGDERDESLVVGVSRQSSGTIHGQETPRRTTHDRRPRTDD